MVPIEFAMLFREYIANDKQDFSFEIFYILAEHPAFSVPLQKRHTMLKKAYFCLAHHQ